ncbi:hypothetical protein CVT24_010543 [Panaeolus cyanescens]|uniref:Protein kinase domain-containing protein n=1 Tax=Panaeolus cyanescens TaxID=181874 RepID=A0A409YYH6_9AGAR|nr:hypothetical protein CVT24_010543 [Panaeolus cyanescens]
MSVSFTTVYHVDFLPTGPNAESFGMHRHFQSPRPQVHASSYNGLHDESPPVSPSSSSSCSSLDEDDVNQRIKPYWPQYRSRFKLRGYGLETLRDVRRRYTNHSLDTCPIPLYPIPDQHHQGDDALCPDPSLPDNLFRGLRIHDSKRVLVKAVHCCSREFNIVAALSQTPLRHDPTNHTVPVFDLLRWPNEDISFIVMEEWSPPLINGPCCLTLFLKALRQCIQHTTFLHKNHIAHLDISLMNIVTNGRGQYAFIDYELSRRFDSNSSPLVYNYRGTEVPPECETKSGVNPYKIDIWALAVLILRACKQTGFWVPELMQVIKPMLDEDPARRPSACTVLQTYDKLVHTLTYKLERCDADSR